jgi:S-DNA-T family DNA segregation ATPase FtsK/SpoIIIE
MRKINNLQPPPKNYQGVNIVSKIENKNIIGIALIIFVAFIFLSIFSYNANDSCINVASDEKMHNIGGHYGAIIADLTLQLLGFSTGIGLAIMLIWSLAIIVNSRVTLLWLRIPSAIITMCSTSIVFAALLQDYNFSFQMLPGGYIGYYLLEIYHNLFGTIMSVVISFFTFIITFYFSLGIDTKSSAKIKLILKQAIFVLNVIKSGIGTLLNIITLRFIFDAIANRQKIGIVVKEMLNSEDDKQTNKNIRNNLPINPDIAKEYLSTGDKVTQTTNTKIANVKLSGEHYRAPSSQLLTKIEVEDLSSNRTIIEKKMQELLQTLNDFGVKGQITNYHIGPVVTLYELQPQAGTKSARVIGLSSDIARTMQVVSTRISAVPGRDVIGIEIPNPKRQPVMLRQIIESAGYSNSSATIPIILGKNITGEPQITDLTKMPHLLIAGTTGSGKSIGMNTMILSILYKLPPEKCRLIMIDPKMLEFSLYDGIPHLLTPVITSPKKAILSLKWVVAEMTKRYKLMSNLGVRNISGYNDKVAIAQMRGGQIVREIEVGYDKETGEVITEKITVDAKTMPYIVVIIDEMADLMLVAGKEIEALVQRLAQMARAAGIHLIMATQRPSVDVITGVIKANFPTRISYQVTSKIDSRTILGEQGAEQLLGQGDMLYMALGGKITRIHGCYVSDNEVESVVKYLKAQYPVEYIDIAAEILNEMDEDSGSSSSNIATEYDDFIPTASGESDEQLYKQAIKVVMQDKKTSISYIQRKLRIGYNKAANFIEKMEKEGIISTADGTGKRFIIGEK